MSDWTLIVTIAFFAAFYLSYRREVRNFTNHVEQLHKAYGEERKELLDRIMSNNIQEYKAYSEQVPVKRSESGNFLIDQMNTAMKKQFLDE